MKKFGLFIIALALSYGLSWLSVCGVIKLVTLCFNLKFKWNIATGIWIIFYVLCSVIRVLKK